MSPGAVAFRRVRPESPLLDLHEAERALLGPRATPNRRAEFAAGRRAARAALRRLLGAAADSCVILRSPEGAGTGRPVPLGANGEPLPAHVSITHASGRAVAVAGAEPVGVDLVALEPLDSAFREEAFQEGELAAWEAFLEVPAGGARAACAAFAAKEAAVKWLGCGLTIPLLAVRVVPRRPVRPGRLGRCAAAAFALDVGAPGARRSLGARIAVSSGFVLVAAFGA